MNAAAGRPVEVSADTVHLVSRSIEAWRASACFVDCTRLADVVTAGYDRSFELLTADPGRTAPRGKVGEPAAARPGFTAPDDIVIDGSTVTIPVGVGFDPGGIGKGVAADLVATELLAAGASGACVSVGGDLRVVGSGPHGGTWTIAIDHPRRAEPLTLVGLSDGAVASSTTLRRRWTLAGRTMHHLIDPRTGRPADGGVEFAAAIAGEAWLAETMAKAVLLRGADHPFDLVDGTGIEAIAVTDDGDVLTTTDFVRFTGGITIGVQR